MITQKRGNNIIRETGKNRKAGMPRRASGEVPIHGQIIRSSMLIEQSSILVQALRRHLLARQPASISAHTCFANIKLVTLFLFVLLTILIMSTSAFAADNTSIGICGDGICAESETKNTCSIDCSFVSFTADVPLQKMRVAQGEAASESIELRHSSIYKTTYSIKPSDNLAPYITLNQTTITLESPQVANIETIFFVAKDKQVTNVIGNITVTGTNDKQTISYAIPISLEVISEKSLTILVDAAVQTDIPYPDEDLSYFVTMSFLANKETTADVNVYAIHIPTNESILLETFTVPTFASYSKLRNVNINRTQFELQVSDLYENYNLVVDVAVDNIHAQGVSVFTLHQKFFESIYFRVLITIIIIIPAIYIIGVAYRRYEKFMTERQRYIKPDFTLLPKTKSDEPAFNVGFIADTTTAAYIAPKDLTTHTLVAGSTGSGKSVAASIIVEAALNAKIPAVVFDPTAQWTGFLNTLKDPNILSIFPKFHLKPDDVRSYRGLIFTPKTDTFELDVDEYLNPGEVTVFNLSNLSTQQYDLATYKIITSLFSKRWEESPDLKLIVVFDEVHRLLDPLCTGQGYEALTKACREFRKWGIGLIMVSQVSTDFKEAIGGNVLTEIQLNTKNLEDIKKAGQKYGPEFARRITRQGVGVAMVQNAKYNKGKPWFINFRPPFHNPHKLSEEDLATYEEFTAKLKKIKVKIKEIASQDKDTEELDLDYKLASNKLKEGKFKMADIYIQDLTDKLNLDK